MFSRSESVTDLNRFADLLEKHDSEFNKDHIRPSKRKSGEDEGTPEKRQRLDGASVMDEDYPNRETLFKGGEL